ncbi:MAG: Mannose-6-phosphate isomerase [Frankiales bacterium]|nr:Mannose-6-phosphate isomerase [Frankiales bacterium]
MTVDLDDAGAVLAGDPGGMLLAVASSAAQVREAAHSAGEADLAELATEGRPRAVIVLGMGGSAIAGDVLASVAGTGCPVPILSHRGYGLPAWVGAADLVIAVSCSGHTEETLSGLEEAVRRGSRLLVVGASGSPLHELGQRGRAVFVPVPQGRQPRASIWSLSVPLLAAGQALGLLTAGPTELEEAAIVLERLATACRPDGDSVTNPGKTLAGELTDTLPVLWGTSLIGGTAAYRFACQLNENAGSPATWGVLPEANHNQVVSFDGRWAQPTATGDDFFRDREAELERPGLRLVLLRDGVEHPQVARRAEVSAALASERGVAVTTLRAEGVSAVARLASLIGLADYASTYLAILEGTDPTPVDAITALKERIA